MCTKFDPRSVELDLLRNCCMLTIRQRADTCPRRSRCTRCLRLRQRTFPCCKQCTRLGPRLVDIDLWGSLHTHAPFPAGQFVQALDTAAFPAAQALQVLPERTCPLVQHVSLSHEHVPPPHMQLSLLHWAFLQAWQSDQRHVPEVPPPQPDGCESPGWGTTSTQ